MNCRNNSPFCHCVFRIFSWCGFSITMQNVSMGSVEDGVLQLGGPNAPQVSQASLFLKVPWHCLSPWKLHVVSNPLPSEITELEEWPWFWIAVGMMARTRSQTAVRLGWEITTLAAQQVTDFKYTSTEKSRKPKEFIQASCLYLTLHMSSKVCVNVCQLSSWCEEFTKFSLRSAVCLSSKLRRNTFTYSYSGTLAS